MEKSPRAAWLLAVSLLGGVAAFVGQMPEVHAAKREAAPKINPKILKPLQAANELAKAENYAEAEIELQKAEAVSEKTVMERFQIDELGGFIALKQRKYDAAAKALESGHESGLLPPELVNDRLRLLSQLFLQTDPRNLDKSAENANHWPDHAKSSYRPLLAHAVHHVRGRCAAG
jgi:hypothetical protein